MKVTILHGSKKNCGDFLIKDSAISLLKNNLSISHEDIYSADVVRTDLSREQMAQIEESSVAVLAGGPGYRQNFYPKTYPSIKDILDVTPVVCLGPGWKANDENQFSFSHKSTSVLERITDQECCPFLGARDLPSVRILRKHGVPAKLTGCPGWYCYNGLSCDPNFSSNSPINSIAVSTPPKNNVRHLLQFILLVRMLLSEFPHANIRLMFHRGEQELAFNPELKNPFGRTTWKNSLASLLYGFIKTMSVSSRVDIHDASGSSSYSRVYFKSDIHVGYRVHAHIPALSSGTPSFLLQIDGRGFGISESLGTDADVSALKGIIKPIKKIKNNITLNIQNNFSDFNKVDSRMKKASSQMRKLIHSLKIAFEL